MKRTEKAKAANRCVHENVASAGMEPPGRPPGPLTA
jgi:hypothetical protein